MPRRAVLITLFLVLCASSAACADVSEWYWHFRPGADFGTASGASDDLDALDIPMDYQWSKHVGVFHEFGTGGWTGPTGFYGIDMRSPLEMLPGNSKTWRLYLWGDLTYPPQYDFLAVTWSGGGMSSAVLDCCEFRLTYVRSAVGVIDDWNTVGDSILLNEQADGGEWWFPVYRTDNGLDGYIFDLTATVIPEPASVLALTAGLGALILRRRR